MNAVQMPLSGPVQPKHLNRGLFSDYYLNEIIPLQSDWLSMANAARPVYDALRHLLAQIDPAALDEAQLENQWVQLVLRQLGHHYSVQVKVRYRQTGYRKPDYVFAPAAEQARALTGQIYTPQELGQAGALAVGDAKRWGVNLDQAAGPGERNPSQQIDEYLRYSELPWGILTDGRYWRLYERDTSKNNVYYAVDLMDLLQRNDVDAFLYFYAFFRREAFTDNWLRKALEGSIDFAQRLSDRLEDQVYDALERIAQGFLEYRRNQLAPTPETLQTIYEQSLVLLYRLLFILYAESRGILPLGEHDAYTRAQSLDAIKKAVARMSLGELNADHTRIYTQLTDLFFSLDKGNPQFGLPPYNGRLFSEPDHPFLASKAVGDYYLAPALDMIARVPDEKDPTRRVFVDYRDLDVRHLGAIYEKLLEYQLDIAAEPLALRAGRYVQARNGETPVKRAGEVYLRTGNYERKITGSYYTPDYIVRFIVERTLEPLLTEITRQYATLNEEGHWQVHDPARLRDAILALNVLDPATGSGHFLVEAAAFIAEWLRGLALAPADLAEGEDELTYWKRQVVNACIYGVDVNPLAVELAKLSLWLATLARGRPLSFLDHHVKVGNSLVGARVRDVGAELVDPDAERRGKARRAEAAAAGQLALLDDADFAPAVSSAVSGMAAIERVVAETVDTVKEQEQMYARLMEEMAVWKRVADVWLARYFGLALDQARWAAVRAHLLGKDDGQGVEAALEEAARVAGEQRFFHWELEFPEVFFQPDGRPLAQPGFDAVIGNPPYVRQERIQPIKPYLETKYRVYQGTADLFLYFYELGLRFLKPGQRMGYITSGTYMNSNSASAFRRYIHENARFETAVNFGENQPFRGAEMVYPTIAILRKDRPAGTFRSLFIEGTRVPASLDEALEHDGVDVASDVTGMEEWRFQAVELAKLFGKITEGCALLGEVISGNMFRGVTTGLNDAFIIDSAIRERLIGEHRLSGKIIKPVLRGQDLRPWYQIANDLFLLFTRRGINIDEYPAIKDYLGQFRTQLEPQPDDWDVRKQGSWQGRKAGSYLWFEIQDQIAYFEKFETPKIVWPDISKLPRFSWNEGSYLVNTGFIITDAAPWLLALLQSRVLWFAISQIAQPLRLRAGLWQYRVIPQFVERLPIPHLTAGQESALSEIAEAITAKARERYAHDEAMRRRIAADLGLGGRLNTRLEEWWTLEDVSDLRRELGKAFKADIPLHERDEWEKYLAAQKSLHEAMMAEIVALETRMNAIVYEAFRLTPDEIALVERVTKYPYGEV